MKKRWILLLLFVLVGCGSMGADFEDPVIADIKYDDEESFDGRVIGQSHDLKYLAIIEEDEFIIYDVEEDAEISSSHISDKVMEAIDLRWHAEFSIDKKYVLFTTQPGEVPEVFKSMRTADVYVYNIEEEDFVRVLNVDEDADMLGDDIITYLPTWGKKHELFIVEMDSEGKEHRVNKFNIEEDDFEPLYTTKFSDFIVDMEFLGEERLLVITDDSDLDKRDKVIVVNTKTGDDETILKVKGVDAQPKLIGRSVNGNRILLKVGYGGYVSTDSYKLLDISDLEDPVEYDTKLGEEDRGYSYGGFLTPGGDYLFYTDNSIAKDKSGHFVTLLNINDDDKDILFELEDEEFDVQSFGVNYSYPGKYTLPIFMYDKETLYVYDNKKDEYYVFEFKE